MTVKWRVALSLDMALAQLNAAAPNRSKASDGSIGNAEHAARSSDHNPWVDDPDSDRNVVTARDFTHDPGAGADMAVLIPLWILDKRAKCGIFQGLFYDKVKGKVRVRPYREVNPAGFLRNPHNHHGHLSAESDKALYDDTAPWAGFAKHSPAVPTPTPVVSDRPTLRKGDKGPAVKLLQENLNRRYPAYSRLRVDSDFGPGTEAVVREYQRRAGLSIDGVVGPRTWASLGL